MRNCCFVVLILLLLSPFRSFSIATHTDQKPPNILWIYVEDISPHLSSYGETTIKTPNIDGLAKEGMLFENAYVSTPICSPSRSALISGMYPPTLGAHNHRSQMTERKASGNVDYYESYELPEEIRLVPELLKQAGYYTILGGPQPDELPSMTLSKADYNFVWDTSIYDSGNWKSRAESRPFFAQIQLKGGKSRDAEVQNMVDPAEVQIPPYYPDIPSVREAWARYLNAIQKLDTEVGKILAHLEKEGEAENTVVFFFSDHGISAARGKQFLYDEGLHIPLIVRWPGHIEAGTRNSDLINHLDIAATSLDIAGIEQPDYMVGRSFLSPDYKSRKYIYSTRDRADETVDIIRSIRTKQYKYIRNFYVHRPHAQPNRYRNSYEEMQAMRRMYAEGELTPLQASLFWPARPPEELYDVEADPHETRNLASDPAYRDLLLEMRGQLINKMKSTRDMGLMPEPLLEELGKTYGNKYYILQQPKYSGLVDSLLQAVSAENRLDRRALLTHVNSDFPSVRYWAATGLGNLGQPSPLVIESLKTGLMDNSATVRVASALALCKLGYETQGLPELERALEHNNLLVQLYAINGLEEIGDKARPLLEKIKAKREGRYEYVRRVATRLTRLLAE